MLETFAMVLYLVAFAISTRLATDTEKQMLSIGCHDSYFYLCWTEIVPSRTVCACVSFWARELPCNEGMTTCLQTHTVNYIPLCCVRARICVCVVHKKRGGEKEGGVMLERDQTATWSYSAAYDAYMIRSKFTGRRNILKLNFYTHRKTHKAPLFFFLKLHYARFLKHPK